MSPRPRSDCSPSAFATLNADWRDALRRFAGTTLAGERGPYMPIKGKSLGLLERLWADRKDESLPDLGDMLTRGLDVRVFGDPHFEHAGIIFLCARPFADVATMDQALWEKIAAAHSEADMVLCLGDLALKNPVSWHRRLGREFPGKQITVVGNHDARGSTAGQWSSSSGAFASLAFTLSSEIIRSWIERFESESACSIEWASVPDTISVGISHWPVNPAFLPGSNWVNLHGHSHQHPSRRLRINASLEQTGYAPVSISRLLDARVIADLVERQSGLDGFVDEPVFELAY